MRRAMIRCLLGVLLIVVGQFILNASTQRMKAVISPPPPAVTSELPRDPEDRAQEPDIRRQLDEAGDWAQLSRLVQVSGVVIIAWPLLVWAIRLAKKAHAKQETEHAGTCGTGTDSRSGGSNGVRNGEADRTVAEPSQTIASIETAHRSDGPSAHVVDEGRSDARA